MCLPILPVRAVWAGLGSPMFPITQYTLTSSFYNHATIKIIKSGFYGNGLKWFKKLFLQTRSVPYSQSSRNRKRSLNPTRNAECKIMRHVLQFLTLK
jgi:hypothetical protein